MSPELLAKEKTTAGESDSRRDTNPDLLEGFDSKTASLPAFVDRLELALSKCLADYRASAEEAMAKHLEEIEAVQNANEHQLASVIVENCALRQQLGLTPSDSLPRMLFQNQQKPQPGGKRTRGAWMLDDDEDSRFSSRSQSKSKLPLQSSASFNCRGSAATSSAPGGSWQPLMAWIPQGAALSHAEPWKSLPQAWQSSPQAATKHSSRTKAKQPSVENLHSILPGTANSVKIQVDKVKDSDDSGSENTSETSSPKQEFDLLDVFVTTSKQQKKMRKNSQSKSEGGSSVAFREEDEFRNLPQDPFIVNPDSRARICWDLMSLLMVSYDMIAIPMDVFAMSPSIFLDFMDWSTRLFWTVDIAWSCCTGVVLADGIIEYSRHAILRRYAKTWLIPDVIIVLSDWVSLAVSSGGIGLGRLARGVRMARAVRLLRLLRMQEVLANLQERIQSEAVGLVVQVGKLLLLLAVTCHYIACLWWAVGQVDSGQTWMQNVSLEDDLGSKYLVSLMWATSQFSGASDEVQPISSLERCVAVLVGMLSVVLSMVLLGNLTSSLTQRYILDGNGARQMAILKSYLRQNGISKNLVKRLSRNAQHAVSGDLTADGVQLLTVISEPLKIQMHFEMYSRLLVYHPFFYDMLNEGNGLMRRFCHQVMGMLLLASGDLVFSLWEEPTEPKMYIVESGTLDYSDEYGEVQEVRQRDWLAEPVLWTTWKHQGNLVASSDVKLAMLDAQSFQDICKQQIMAKKSAVLPITIYAAEFVKELNEKERPTDLKE